MQIPWKAFCQSISVYEKVKLKWFNDKYMYFKMAKDWGRVILQSKVGLFPYMQLTWADTSIS